MGSSPRDAPKIKDGCLLTTSTTGRFAGDRRHWTGRGLGQSICSKKKIRTVRPVFLARRAANDAPGRCRSVGNDGRLRSTSGSVAPRTLTELNCFGRGDESRFSSSSVSVFKSRIGSCGNHLPARSKKLNAMNIGINKIGQLRWFIIGVWCALFTAREHSWSPLSRLSDVLDSPARVCTLDKAPFARSNVVPWMLPKRHSPASRTSWRSLRDGTKRRSVRAHNLPGIDITLNTSSTPGVRHRGEFETAPTRGTYLLPRRPALRLASV